MSSFYVIRTFGGVLLVSSGVPLTTIGPFTLTFLYFRDGIAELTFRNPIAELTARGE